MFETSSSGLFFSPVFCAPASIACPTSEVVVRQDVLRQPLLAITQAVFRGFTRAKGKKPGAPRMIPGELPAAVTVRVRVVVLERLSQTSFFATNVSPIMILEPHSSHSSRQQFFTILAEGSQGAF